MKLNISDLTPRQLLELWTRMAGLVITVNRQRPPMKAHGARALKRRARRRRSQAKLLTDRRRGFRAFGERQKLGTEAVHARELRYAAARKRRAS